VCTGNTAVSIQITQSISQIELLEQQLNVLDETIKSIMIETDSVILIIPGIGFLRNWFSKWCNDTW
jgi:transposase